MPHPSPGHDDFTAFDLPARHIGKSDPSMIGADEERLASIAAALHQQHQTLHERITDLQRSPERNGQAAMDRDAEIRRLQARQRLFDRFGIDLCLGRMTPTDGSEPLYIGRVGLTDESGARLLLDWRTPAAKPFFAATWQDPCGISSRRRFRWANGKIIDYWDEAFTEAGLTQAATLDDQSAFIASLGTRRSSRMREVLTTIQKDQDAIIRADARGALVVDGGPGTGKTVVALHRVAHLLYTEQRLTRGGGGVLFVGPTNTYLSYVEDVLPNLGEDNVRMCTLRDLVPEGPMARAEKDPAVTRAKAALDPVSVIDAAVSLYERPPKQTLYLETSWAELSVGRAEWLEAFGSADPGVPHNEARDEVWNVLLEVLTDQIDDPDVSVESVGRYLRRDEELTETFLKAWPLLHPHAIVADLWTQSDIGCPSLDEGWTIDDLPFLDAAHQRIGDPDKVRDRHRREAEIVASHQEMSRVVDQLIESDDSEMQVMSMLKGQDQQDILAEVDGRATIDPDALAGPFGHIVVDEAQELTRAQWRMLLRRCPSRSFTIVGDRAQARDSFAESWVDRLESFGFTDIRVETLSINYRTPTEVMAVAEPVIRAVLPDANVPTSVRSSGFDVTYARLADRDALITEWLDTHHDGVACVIGDPSFQGFDRVRSLDANNVKGLEFDLVLLNLNALSTDAAGAVDQYVAMTRATERLIVLSEPGHSSHAVNSSPR